MIPEVRVMNEMFATDEITITDKDLEKSTRAPLSSGNIEEEELLSNANLISSMNETPHSIIPFRFNLTFIYKMFFYFYLNFYNGAPPFGRTIPDLKWMYIVIYIFDPKNFLGL